MVNEIYRFHIMIFGAKWFKYTCIDSYLIFDVFYDDRMSIFSPFHLSNHDVNWKSTQLVPFLFDMRRKLIIVHFGFGLFWKQYIGTKLAILHMVCTRNGKLQLMWVMVVVLEYLKYYSGVKWQESIWCNTKILFIMIVTISEFWHRGVTVWSPGTLSDKRTSETFF